MECNRQPPDSELTPRMHDVLLLLANGASYQDIARRLGVDIQTVKSHTQRLRKKLGARDSAHAVGIALRMHLLCPIQVELPPCATTTREAVHAAPR